MSAAVVDVRSDDPWAQGRVAEALHMPCSEITERASKEIPARSTVVVYCWTPGCNAGAKGALEFCEARLRGADMIGGFEYWGREGDPIESADGVHRRPINPSTGVPRIRARA